MLEGVTQSIIHAVDRLIARYGRLMKGYLPDYCPFETTVDSHTFVTTSGVCVSYIEVDGIVRLLGEAEYKHLIASLELLLNGLLKTPAHSLHWCFSRLASQTRDVIHKQIDPLKRAAEHQQLKPAVMDVIFSERVKTLEKYIVEERNLLAFMTAPDALSRSEKKAEQDESHQHPLKKLHQKEKLPVRFGHYAQRLYKGVKRLNIIHQAALKTFMDTCQGDVIGLKMTLLDCHQALNKIRLAQFPNETNPDWRPVLPGDPIPYRDQAVISGQKDNEFYPMMGSQLFKRQAEKRDGVIKMGDDYWASTSMIVTPQAPERFDQLFHALPKDTDWRYSFHILGGDQRYARKIRTRRSMAKVFKIMNGSHNNPIIDGCDALLTLNREGEVLNGVRVGLAIRDKSEEAVREKNQLCARLMQAWGNCDTSVERGDPVDALVSTLPGLDSKSTGTTLIQPVCETTILSPITRPTSPWEFGTNLYRTPDGKLFPIASCSSLQQFWVMLIFAEPGSGKSVLQNVQNLSLCLTPGLSQLPKISILDIGPSSRGLIELLQATLPESRRGEAVHHTLKNDKSCSINVFDTALGMRYPHMSKVEFIKSFLLTLFTEDGETNVKPGLGELTSALIQETYKKYSDDYEPKHYTLGMEYEIDSLIQTHPDWFYQKTTQHKRGHELTWWAIVDVLAEHEMWRIAGLAQRQAVPLLLDLTGVLRESQLIRDIFACHDDDQKVVIHLNKMITHAMSEYRMLSYPTQFNIGEARVIALDLADVTGGSSNYSLKRTALMYLLGREALVGNLYFSDKDVEDLPPIYRRYHQTQINQSMSDIKRLCLDEFHRTAKVDALRHQIEQDIREARKFKVEICLTSQRDTDFTEGMIEMATSIYFCNRASGEKLKRIVKHFGLKASEERALEFEVKGASEEGASFLLKCKTKKGDFSQVLMNSMSLLELWALNSTAEDAVVRKKLIQKLPYFSALTKLVKRFPSGTAKKFIETMAQREGLPNDMIIDQLIDDMVNEKEE